MKESLLKNKYLINLPILFLYVIFILIKNRTLPEGDGTRYWDFSSNLLEGFYANGEGPGFLWNGPGYPIFISFFRLFTSNVLLITLLNAFLIYFSCVIISKITENFTDKRLIINIAPFLFIISSPFLLITSTYLYTEPLTIFLLNLGCYQSLMLIKKFNFSRFLLITILFGMLILTKVIFAYVILTFLMLSIFKFLNKRSRINLNLLLLLFASLLITTPYQFYTYSLTKEYFYFSDAGGDLLYWLSSPHEEDLGQWQEKWTPFFDETIKNKYYNLNSELIINLNNQIFLNREKNHGDFLKSLKGLNGVEVDKRLKEKALQNIKGNPKIFLKNLFLNISRLFLGYPFSLYFKPPFTPIFSVINLLISSLFMWMYIIGSIFSYKTNLYKDPRFQFLMIFTVLYIGGISMLANQSQRFLLPVTGLLVVISLLPIIKFYENKPK